jgi:hypothetical protein
MNDEQYRYHCHELVAEFAQMLAQRTENLPEQDPLREFALAWGKLALPGSDLYGDGPALIDRLFTTYTELAPRLARQLLWFFGGDSLHYMADDEITQFQRLEDLRLEAVASGDTFDLRDASAKLLNLQ